MQLSQLELIPILSKEIEITNLSKNDFVLSNKKYKHYLKISKEVKDLLSFIDSKRNVTEVTDLYNSKFNSSLKADFVYSLVYLKLSKYGLLENHGEIKIKTKPNYLKLSVIVLNEKKVAKIVKYFHFVFKPKIAVFFLILACSFFSYTLYKLFGANQEFNLHASILYLSLFTIISGIYTKLVMLQAQVILDVNMEGLELVFISYHRSFMQMSPIYGDYQKLNESSLICLEFILKFYFALPF